MEWLASSWVSLFCWWEVIWSVLDASEERIAHVCPWRYWMLGTVLSHCISSLLRNRPCTMPAELHNERKRRELWDHCARTVTPQHNVKM